MSGEDLFERASKTLMRAKRKHQEAITKFTEKFIQEIDAEVIRKADQGYWCLAIVMSESRAYQKMVENDKYFPGLGDLSAMLTVAG